MTLKKANEIRPREAHETLKQLKHASAAGCSDFWQCGHQLPRMQRTLVPESNTQMPLNSEPCSCSPVCLGVSSPATAERQLLLRAASTVERREGHVYRSEMFVNGWSDGELGFGEVEGHDRWSRRSVAICRINNHPLLLQDKTPQGNIVGLLPTSEMHEASQLFSLSTF